MAIIEESLFGSAPGRAARLFTMRSGGVSVSFTNLGCTLTSFTVPDSSGCPRDIVLGYDDAAGYWAGSSSLGATVGRYAGRIANARFSLNGKEFFLDRNDGANHLHGGFGKRFFAVREVCGRLVFTLVSPHMDEGFPGELRLAVTVELEGGLLRLTYEAETDRDTHLNITNHSYFNLNGGGDVGEHRLLVNSDRYLELGQGMIPTGLMLPAAGTALDFAEERPIGPALLSPALASTGGIDHSFVLPGGGLRTAAVLSCDESGIALACRTTQPSVHIYTANFLHLDSNGVGRNGAPLIRHGGVCLETQHFPDSPNRSEFPSTLLKAGERFREVTEYEVHDGTVSKQPEIMDN